MVRTNAKKKMRSLFLQNRQNEAQIEGQLQEAEREATEEAVRKMLAERNHFSAVLAKDYCLHCHDRDCDNPCPLQCNCQQLHNA